MKKSIGPIALLAALTASFADPSETARAQSEKCVDDAIQYVSIAAKSLFNSDKIQYQVVSTDLNQNLMVIGVKATDPARSEVFLATVNQRCEFESLEWLAIK